MKALEYYEKYADAFFPEEGFSSIELYLDRLSDNIRNLLIDLNDESIVLLNSREVKTSNGFASIIKEQNQKYNALCRIFEQKHGTSPLKLDGYKTFIEREMPDLKYYMRGVAR